MSEIIEAKVNGKTIYIETEFVPGSEEVSAAKKTMGEVENAMTQARETIISVAESLFSSVKAIDQALTPDEFLLEFAIKFTAEGQVVVAKASAEAGIKVALTYRHNKAKSSKKITKSKKTS